MPPRILIVDDEPNILDSFSSLLAEEGYSCATASTAEKGLKVTQTQPFDLILLDLQLPGMSGLDFLSELKALDEAALVLVISGQADIPSALQAVRSGALDFLEKPVPAEKLIASVRAALMVAEANHQRNLIIDTIEQETQIIGQSNATRKLLKTIDQVAPTESTVLIQGENGTGKELAATRLFLKSERRDKPFIRVNCPGIPETLFESELFGHRRGAFTGAVKDHPGKFVMADRGTIFLDEIGDLPLSCQAKLLRVLETGEVETLGSSEMRHTDVRVICATNRDLQKLVTEGKFRQDLYYRISVFLVEIPPLSSRTDDIPLMIGEFLRRYDPTGRTSLSAQAVAWLSAQEYPGNVRQLKNCIERLTILYRDREIQINEIHSAFGSKPAPKSNGQAGLSLADNVNAFERNIIAETLQRCGGNISRAARELRIDRTQLSRKVRDLGLKTE